LPLGDRDGLEVVWLDLPPGAPPGWALVGAVAAAPIGPGTRVWVAGEAAAVQRIRRALFEERGVPRRRATVRGDWKHGRAGTAPPAGRPALTRWAASGRRSGPGGPSSRTCRRSSSGSSR